MNKSYQEFFQEHLREKAEEAMRFIRDSAAREQMLDRFQGQYFPAIMEAPMPDHLARAWEAFRYYITAPATRRKPFALSEEEAEQVLSALNALLREVGKNEP